MSMRRLFNPFQPSVVFPIEVGNLIFSARQMTGVHIKGERKKFSKTKIT